MGMIIKFRQPMMLHGNFNRWHYWGFIKEDYFVSPLDRNQGGNSYQAVSCVDKIGKDAYQGDIVTDPLTKAVYVIGWVSSKGRNQLIPINLPLSHHYVREMDCLCDYEIIGNSVENPELLDDRDPGAPGADPDPEYIFSYSEPDYPGAADRIIKEIRADIEAGMVSRDVGNFSELHDYVDANEYLALIFPEWDIERDTDYANVIMDMVDRRIQSGELHERGKQDA